MYKLTSIAALLLVATTATAQDGSTRWITRPPQEATAELMPGFALRAGIDGRVGLSCVVATPGPPDHCDIVSVSPEGLGFESAALTVARTGIVRPSRINGAYVPSTFKFVVNFSAQDVRALTGENAIYEGPTPSTAALGMARVISSEGADLIRPRMRDDMLEGLAPERQATVIKWIDELIPIDVDRLIDQKALAMARMFTEAELEAYLASGTIPENPFPDYETIQAATVDFEMPGYLQGLDELRSRYCERWSCEIVIE